MLMSFARKRIWKIYEQRSAIDCAARALVLYTAFPAGKSHYAKQNLALPDLRPCAPRELWSTVREGIAGMKQAGSPCGGHSSVVLPGIATEQKVASASPATSDDNEPQDVVEEAGEEISIPRGVSPKRSSPLKSGGEQQQQR